MQNLHFITPSSQWRTDDPYSWWSPSRQEQNKYTSLLNTSLQACQTYLLTAHHTSRCTGQWGCSSTMSLTGQPLDGAQLWLKVLISASTVLRQLSSVDCTSAAPLGSVGLQLWWWSWHPCAAHAQSSAINFWWWWSPYHLAGTLLRSPGCRCFLARRCQKTCKFSEFCTTLVLLVNFN